MGTGNVYSTYDPTALFAGQYPVRHRPITLAANLNASGTRLPRGTLLGRSSIGAVSSAAKAGGNTGNGTLTLDATTPALASAKSGAYNVQFTAATVFNVYDPTGTLVGGGTVGTPFAAQIKFTIAAGGTAFVAGDGFVVTIAAADVYNICKATAIDGSQNPATILAADTDTSAGSITASGYTEGEFAYEKMNVDASWSVTTLQAALRQANSSLYVRSVGTLG